MRTSRQMRRLADALIDPIRVPVPADPEALFEALVASVAAWRGREIVVRRETFPPHTASGLWLDAGTHDVVVVDRRAAVWHQIVILCHEVWHMNRHAADAEAEPSPAGDGRARAVAARTDFSLTEEQEADRFGMLMGRRLRGWLEAPQDSVYAARDDDAEGLAGRIGAALNYRGPHR
ncbi:toxin [Streptomyces sp. CL12-4]|uniref:toxin n=1 Tax=Streptomyces sp. CL12-4 TaxID=2810306 RepID=UPI001EFB74B4|nr:toxin [Streptomyces sp. CL12-4]MCG8968446.1 toxin [Streptomyces sp. CL12-4]